ncbi:MAG: DUF4176 domain-containing protein [Defluviitaleaceae bacterium]|nr:DUF4176 domain-containing protein [Defluviitaleaceae bacterium]MCL2262411.1 DUF4176 domain-containing protein [Defluviitaleaceae bacterium]
MKEYLPLGTIVILKDGQKAIMIYGRQQIHENSGKEFDYVACPYPEGNISDDYTYLFDHEQVDKIIHTGYSCDEDKEFMSQAGN